MDNVRFRQSVSDFPLDVSLGGKVPAWGLSRWGGDGFAPSAGLVFRPDDDEGYVLSGGSKSLLYKGARRSHRFTILNDCAFEYDVILKKEPSSNVIMLNIEGGEIFNFYRQPDFVRDPYLRGSYAVYLKETVIGQGTGKLCHIHRPKIIDALGKTVWGELNITCNRLYITIPEQWLASAKYPVVVDPTVGTTGVGSMNSLDYYNVADREWAEHFFEEQVDVNRFILPNECKGTLAAYFYQNTDYTISGQDIYPVIYSNVNGKPYAKKSREGQPIPMFTGPRGWRNGEFYVDTPLAAGETIWFGGHCTTGWYPRFDWTQDNIMYWRPFEEYMPSDIFHYDSWYQPHEIILSMYFTYSAAQNYTRTIQNWAIPVEVKTVKRDLRRSAKDTGKTTDILGGIVMFLRSIFDAAPAVADARPANNMLRSSLDTVNNKDTQKRSVNIFIRLLSQTFIHDYIVRLFFRSKTEYVIHSRITRELDITSDLR
jgi:hypothetical protein